MLFVTSKPFGCLLVFSSLMGCPAAPREVEAIVELGAQRVEIDVRLRDIRTPHADDLTQLQLFEQFSKWDPNWISDVPWAPTPTRFEYIGDGGTLDLRMHGSMSRADFDKCARAPLDSGVCEKFPLELGKAGYAVRPELVRELRIDPKARAAWPADAGRISYRFGTNEKFLDDGASLVGGFTTFQVSPTAAVDAVKKIAANDTVFLDGTVAEWTKALAAIDACTSEPWCALQADAAGRDQLRLVEAYLRTKAEPSEGLEGAPPRHLDFFRDSVAPLVPKIGFAPIDDLRLRLAYDAQLRRFRERGSTGNASWARVCRPDSMKQPALKDFCARLGVKTKK